MNFTATVAIQQEGDWFVAKCLENSVASQGKNIEWYLESYEDEEDRYDWGDKGEPKGRELL